MVEGIEKIEDVGKRVNFWAWATDKLFMGMTLDEYIRKNITPFNIIAGLIVLVGLFAAVVRFSQGLGAATHLTQTYPWGLWIGVDVLCGVALAAGGFTLGTAVYVFGMKEYEPIVRPAILTGFLGYFFVVIGLLFDLGRPWRLPYPMVYSYGVSSVMFLVAWHVALYLSCQFVEFCPAIFEWLNMKTFRKWVAGLTVAATVFGAILSTLHQSALGALFLLAPTKVHPLWYTPLIPLLFLVSAIIAGISMVIFESTLSHSIFRHQVDSNHAASLDNLTIGLGKAASATLFAYFFLKIIALAHGQNWHLLGTPYGIWYMVEMLGFVLLPCFLYAWGVRERKVRLVRFTSGLAVIGIIINRVNVAIIGFNWNLPVRYFPHWMEFAITISIITTGILTFRWIVNRMPVLYEHPEWKGIH